MFPCRAHDRIVARQIHGERDDYDHTSARASEVAMNVPDEISLRLTQEERAFVMALLARLGGGDSKDSSASEFDPDEFERLRWAVDDKLRSADTGGVFTAGGLLIESRAPLARMRELGLVRTANAPAGDFAEWLVQKATDGELAPNSQKGWDVATDAGERIQVKARFVSDPIKAGQRQLSAFRSFDFDSLVVVFLDDTRPVLRASHIARETVEAGAIADEYVRANRVIASDALMASGEDWTARLQEVAAAHLSNYLD